MKTLIKVILIAFLWITLVNSGTIYGDTAMRLDMAHAWLKGTPEISVTPDFKPKQRGDVKAGVLGVGGKRHAPYDIGQSLLMLPGDWLGTQLQQFFPHTNSTFLRRLIVNFLIFIPLNVVTIIACYFLLKLFDFEEKIASLASIIWLIGTTILHYSQANAQNNQLLLFVTIGYATGLACVLKNNLRFAFLSGLALGATVLIRFTSVIHVFNVLIFILACTFYKNRNPLEAIRVVGITLGGFSPIFLIGRIFDYSRFGSFLATAGGVSMKQINTDPIFNGLPTLPPNYPFINPPYIGILGVLFSPAKSIFIYDPLLLPCLVLGIIFWKRFSPYIKLYLLTTVFDLCLHIVLTSRLDFWHGDAGWAARYHLTSVHLILIPLVAVFIQYLFFGKRLIQWLLSGIIVISIMVQMSSVVLKSSTEVGAIYFAKPENFLQFRLGNRINNLACLINHYSSEDCREKLNSGLSNNIRLFPFNFTKSRTLVLTSWGLALGLTIAYTINFYLTSILTTK